MLLFQYFWRRAVFAQLQKIYNWENIAYLGKYIYSTLGKKCTPTIDSELLFISITVEELQAHRFLSEIWQKD